MKGLAKTSRLIFLLLLSLVSGGNRLSSIPSEGLNQSMPKDSLSISVLTANVGNLSWGCRDVLYKLCYSDVEQRITESIRRLSPDIVALQELLAPWQCQSIRTEDKNKACSEQQTVPQARRVLGDGYSIVCSTRYQFECIAVKTSIGIIAGCEPGALCNTARTVPEISGCDNRFTVSAATVSLHGGIVFDVVNFHPQSTDQSCRSKMLEATFEPIHSSSPIIQHERVLLMGDLNLDPWREKDVSARVWNDAFDKGWGGRKLSYHSGAVETNPPLYTSYLLWRGRTVDIVASNFATGLCRVLGNSPGTYPLDGGKGMDHRAIFGTLTLKAENAE